MDSSIRSCETIGGFVITGRFHPAGARRTDTRRVRRGSRIHASLQRGRTDGPRRPDARSESQSRDKHCRWRKTTMTCPLLRGRPRSPDFQNQGSRSDYIQRCLRLTIFEFEFRPWKNGVVRVVPVLEGQRHRARNVNLFHFVLLVASEVLCREALHEVSLEYTAASSRIQRNQKIYSWNQL